MTTHPLRTKSIPEEISHPPYDSIQIYGSPSISSMLLNLALNLRTTRECCFNIRPFCISRIESIPAFMRIRCARVVLGRISSNNDQDCDEELTKRRFASGESGIPVRRLFLRDVSDRRTGPRRASALMSRSAMPTTKDIIRGSSSMTHCK